jgi:hypothetical protein
MVKNSDIVNHNIDSQFMTWCSDIGILKSDLGKSGNHNTNLGAFDYSFSNRHHWVRTIENTHNEVRPGT